MHPAYAAKLGRLVRKTEVKAQKIDNRPWGFQIQDKLGRVRIFQETLLADTSMEVVLETPFLCWNFMETIGT